MALDKTSTKNTTQGFSNEERKSMQARAKELAAEAKTKNKKDAGLKNVQEAITAMPEPDRSMAQRIHEIIMDVAPDLWQRTWYGMPAYAKEKDGKVLFFFQAASEFDTRYSTLGFNDTANLDDGNMWAASFAIVKLTANEEQQITDLVKKALS